MPPADGPLIRGYRPPDLDTLYAVALATGLAGGDATALYDDPRLLGHVYVGSYAALLPELVLVAEDAGEIGGYVLGAVDTRGFEARQELEWWPPLRATYQDPVAVPIVRRNADQQRCHRIHHPLRMPEAVLRDYPSHLHINLLPRLQGRGVGRALIGRWLRMASAAGSRGVHLGVDPANTRAIGFYQAIGFRRLPAAVPGVSGADWFGVVLR